MKIKAVIRFAYRRDYTQKRESRIRVKTLVRIVKNLSLTIETKTPPMFYSESSYRCYDNKIWKQYHGDFFYKNAIWQCYGWTFNNHLPLFWGCDIVENRGADYSLWGWYAIDDYPPSRYVSPKDQPAAEAIKKYLGNTILQNYLLERKLSS